MTDAISQASPAAYIRAIRCRHGWLEVLDTDTVVGRSLMKYGEWTEAEYTLLSHYLSPGDDVIEVGAHVGAHSLPLAKAISPGTLFAFEPQPLLFGLLSANLNRNRITNVRLHNMGCGENLATITAPTPDYGRPANFGAFSLTGRLDGIADVNQHAEFSLVSIDRCYDLNRLKLIKIDAEGMELEVLKGAENTIRLFKPILFVENERPAQSEALLRWLTAAGYDLYWHIVPLFPSSNFNSEPLNVFGSASCINVLCIPASDRNLACSLEPVTDLRYHPRSVVARNAEALSRKALEVIRCRAREAEARGEDAAAETLYARARELELRIRRAVAIRSPERS